MTGALPFLALGLLISLNAVFVASEFALVRARRDRLKAAQEAGQRGARSALEQLGRMDQSLSACQLGITMTSIGIGFLGEPALAHLLKLPLVGALGAGAGALLAGLLAYALVTAVHITVGEQVPKVYAISRAEAVARWVGWPLAAFRSVFAPAIWVLNAITTALLRVVGISNPSELEEEASAEDLKLLIARSSAQGHLDEDEADMLSGVFDLHEREAREIMTPMHDVTVVDRQATVRDASEACVSSGHTRLLVEADDQVRGVVHAQDLMGRLLTDEANLAIEEVMRDAFMCPETRAVDDLLADLQRHRTSLAVVIDEYGRAVGLVSVEDILEEIVGEITDETDRETEEIVADEHGWTVEGHVPISTLVDHGIELPQDSDAYTSLGGLIMHLLGHVPQAGEEAQALGYTLAVVRMEGHRIERVRITRAAHR